MVGYFSISHQLKILLENTYKIECALGAVSMVIRMCKLLLVFLFVEKWYRNQTRFIPWDCISKISSFPWAQNIEIEIKFDMMHYYSIFYSYIYVMWAFVQCELILENWERIWGYFLFWRTIFFLFYIDTEFVLEADFVLPWVF